MRTRVAALLALFTLALPGLAGAAIELISRAPLRQAPDTTSGLFGRAAISADGRYIAFHAVAPNLVPGQDDPVWSGDVFFHDRAAGTTRLVSHAAGSPTTAADRGVIHQTLALSADGRFLAYTSFARNLVAGSDVDGDTENVYLWDRETGENTLVSRRAGGAGGANGASRAPSLSADGGVLVFESQATDLAPGQTVAHPGENVYLYERATGTVSLVSRSGDDRSFAPTVSADGRFVVYLSAATGLVAGQNDANGAGQDVFLFDRLTGVTTLVSHVSGSALTTPNGSSHEPSLSADGRYVAFGSNGTNLIPGAADDNGEPDAFLYDRLSGAVSLVSADGSGAAEGGFEPRISADGGTVAYFIGDPQFGGQILAYDVPTGSRQLVTRSAASPATFSNQGAMATFSLSADGRIVAFVSESTNLVAGLQDTQRGQPDIFAHDRATGVTVLVSHAASSPVRTGDLASWLPAVSADGSWIAYFSYASTLEAGARDSHESPDLVLHALATGANRYLTRHAPGLASRTGPWGSGEPAVSADGRYVAFASRAALVGGLVVPPRRSNIYLHDRVTNRTVLVSRSTAPGLAGGNADSVLPRISRDGGAVVFTSLAGDLVPGQVDRAGTYDVFHWDRQTGRTTLVSHAHASRTQAGTGQSSAGGVSADGNLVAFNSTAGELAPGQRDVNAGHDVFLWDRRTHATVLVSHHGLRPARTGNRESTFASMSLDGAVIAFDSHASDLVLPVRDRDRLNDAFVYERRTGGISLLSPPTAPYTAIPRISANGRVVAYIAARRDGLGAITVLDRATGESREIVTSTQDPAFPFGLSDDGRWLLFSSVATDVVPGQIDENFFPDLFLFDRVTGGIRLVTHAPGDPLRSNQGEVNEGTLSPDGRWVAFETNSRLLVPAGSPPVSNVFLYDRTTEDVTLASRSALNPPHGGNGGSFQPVVVNGGLVAFTSGADDLVPRDFNHFLSDVFMYVPEE